MRAFRRLTFPRRLTPISLIVALSCCAAATAHAAPSEDPTGPLFLERAAETGLDFVHFNGMSGELYYNEMLGGGAALFDYDNDGDLDVYLVQGTMIGPGKEISDALFPPRHPLPLTDRLYRNDSATEPDGATKLAFTDVTAEAGLVASLYGMGVSSGDYNNDGWVDLYVSDFGSNQLLHNNGDGTFTDVTGNAGVDDTRWTVAASFLDFDNDGWLDLFAANYVDFTYALHKICNNARGMRDYCGPLAYDLVPDRLFRNRGDGTFEDVSARSGIVEAYGGALGTVAADLDGDGLSDIYVANDMTANQLWLNQGDGTFVDDAMLSGSAVNRHGQAESSMGVIGEDFDNDGDVDLFMSHLMRESNTLYVNQGSSFFRDLTLEHGLDTPSWNFTGFGTGWLDYDNDGLLDLLVANGEVRGIELLLQANDPYPLHQTNQLYHNTGDGRYEEVTEQAGEAFELSEVSRGAAFGDIDNDGDTDVVVVNNAGPVRLLVNQVGQRSSWVGLRLVGADGRRDMIGARVALSRTSLAGDPLPTLHRRVHSDSSYASASDLRLLFGLGDDTRVHHIEVNWPSRRSERFDDLEIGRYNRIVEGSGRPLGSEAAKAANGGS